MKKTAILHLVLVLLTVLLAGVTVFQLSGESLKIEALHLQISDENFQVLNEKVDAAHDKGYYEKGENEYVDAEVTYRSEFREAKVRLKGDWLDHFQNKKWSFRLKLQSPLSSDLKVFSIQNPKARGFVDGLVFHWMIRQERIISNEFRFVQLVVNGQNWGAYSFEEHLSQRMIDQQAGAEGVILKFKDDGFFEADIKKEKTDGLIKQAEIKVYGKLKDDPRYEKEVKFATDLMRAYQQQEDSVYNYFDAEKMGMYYAICDLTSAYHAMGWINIRFFFNFETQKLEPIAYDPYPTLDWGKPYLGANYDKVQNDPFETTMIIYNALKNPNIKAAYDTALNKITQPNYVQTFLTENNSSIRFYESELQKEYHDYSYDYELLKSTANEIRAHLP